MENEQNVKQQESGKVEKRFKKCLSQLTALLNGESLYKTTKVGGDDLTKAVAELVKEEKEAAIKTFKEKAVALIKSKREFDSFVIQQQQEMKKKIEEKQKSFSDEADKLFKLVENISQLEKSYLDTLGAAESGTSSFTEETEG